MKSTIAAVLVAMASASLNGPATAEDWQSAISEKLADGGEMHLALLNNGERDGFMRLGWQKLEGGKIFLYDRSMLPSGELYETQEAVLDGSSLYPEWGKVRLHQAATIGYIDAIFEKDSATVTRRRVRPGNDDAIREIAHDDLPADLTMRMSAFVLPLMLSQTAGTSVSFHWYSPLSDQVNPVTLTAREQVVVETPAGSFETVRFEIRGPQPENDIYVTIGDAPKVVRIDVLDQPFQFLALPDE